MAPTLGRPIAGTDIAERYGWVNRTPDDDNLDPLVDTLVGPMGDVVARGRIELPARGFSVLKSAPSVT
jgi:hypothetical protein